MTREGAAGRNPPRLRRFRALLVAADERRA
jgi:hypothetical protein